jgi:O-antigen/teichoic acid export membrane protein
MADIPHDSVSRPDATGTGYMVVGTLIAALAAYGFQVIAARSLGSTAFAPIAVLWTIQFLAFTTVFMPMEQLTIRRLNAETPDAAPWGLFLLAIVAAAALGVAFTAVALDRLLEGEPAYLVLVAALIVGYGGFALGRGFLAGNRRYREYGLTTLSESLFRLALAVLLLRLGVGTVGLGWTLVAGSLVVYVFRPFRADPGRVRGVGRGTVAALAAFVGATSASQTIVAAGPLVVGLLGGTRADVSIVFETFLLFRAPLTVAYSLIARVLPPFTTFVETGRREVLRRWALRLGALGAVAAVAGYVGGATIGPGSVALLLGEEFRPPSGLAAYAGAGVAIATVALFTQQMLIALRATTVLAAAWITGLAAASAAVVVAAGTPIMRVGLGFLVGEVVAFVLIVALVLRRLGGASGEERGARSE